MILLKGLELIELLKKTFTTTKQPQNSRLKVFYRILSGKGEMGKKR